MPSIICAKCGGLTNTAVCDWISPMRKDGKANECYARRNKENTKWVRGCGKPDGFMRGIVNEMINEGKKKKENKMGDYSINKDEFIGDFEDFLRKQQGNISAKCIADSWNELAKEYGWHDRLKVTYKSDEERDKKNDR